MKSWEKATLENATYETRLETAAFGGAARHLAPLRGAIFAAARRFGGACGALRAARAMFCEHRKVAEGGGFFIVAGDRDGRTATVTVARLWQPSDHRHGRFPPLTLVAAVVQPMVCY